MEYLFLAVILYFVLRTAGNLVRLLGGDAASSQEESSHKSAPRRNGWQGPSPRQQTGTARDEPTFWGQNIEDATWRELDGNTNRRNAAH